MNSKISSLFAFLKKAEKLKTELRHSWTSNTQRQESVAEHSWSACLIAILLFKELRLPIDQLKVLKMIIVHDLAEALTGDIPAFEVSQRQTNKQVDEKIAIQKMLADLTDRQLADEIYSLWQEYEDRQTPEAKFVKACDKFDVLIQHLNTDISTWDQGDFGLNPYDSDEKFDFDQFVREFKDEVNAETMRKVEAAGFLEKVKPEHRKKWQDQLQ